MKCVIFSPKIYIACVRNPRPLQQCSRVSSETVESEAFLALILISIFWGYFRGWKHGNCWVCGHWPVQCPGRDFTGCGLASSVKVRHLQRLSGIHTLTHFPSHCRLTEDMYLFCRLVDKIFSNLFLTIPIPLTEWLSSPAVTGRGLLTGCTPITFRWVFAREE